MEERIDEAFACDEHLTVIGPKLSLGEAAPDFCLDYLDLIEMTVRCTRLGDSVGMVRLLNVVNSLERPVCHLVTWHWEKLSTQLPIGVCLYTISTDLPYIQARWQNSTGVIHQTLSAHRNGQFGLAYGVWLKEWHQLQRAVFVIDRTDHIVYAEYLADQMHEPDYGAAMETVKRWSIEKGK